MGDYKLIVGEPGRFNDWYPLPQNGTPLPEEYPLWKLGRFQKLFPEYQLYNVKGDKAVREWVKERERRKEKESIEMTKKKIIIIITKVRFR